MLWANFAKLDIGGGVVQHGLLESAVEIAIVEKHVWIVEPAIEVPFHALDAFHHTFQFLVARQNHEGGIGAFLRRLRIGIPASIDEHLVVLLTNLSYARRCAAWY